MLWFNFILGSNFLVFCFKLIIMLLSCITIPKNKRKENLNPRIKLNHNSNTCLGTCSHESGMVPLPLGKSKGLLLWENLKILCPLKGTSVYFDWPEKKLIFSHDDVAVIYRYIIALYMFYRKK